MIKLLLFFILLFSFSCSDKKPRNVEPSHTMPTKLKISDLKKKLYEKFHRYKNKRSFYPKNTVKNISINISNNATAPSALNFGEAGDTFAVCGENVPNIDDVVTDKELIFQYRVEMAKNPISKGKLKSKNEFITMAYAKDRFNVNVKEEDKELREYAEIEKLMKKEYFSDALDQILSEVMGQTFNVKRLRDKEQLRQNIKRAREAKATELAINEALMFFLRFHQGSIMDQGKNNGEFYFMRDNTNGQRYIKKLIRHAAFLLKYHSTFAVAYAERAACLQRKFFDNPDEKTIIEELTTYKDARGRIRKYDRNMAKNEGEAGSRHSDVNDTFDYVLNNLDGPGATQGSCKVNVDLDATGQNRAAPTVGSPPLKIPSSTGVFSSLSSKKDNLDGKRAAFKKRVDKLIKTMNRTKDKFMIKNLNVIAKKSLSNTGNISSSDQVALGRSVTSTFLKKVNAVTKKFTDAGIARANLLNRKSSNNRPYKHSAEDFVSRINASSFVSGIKTDPVQSSTNLQASLGNNLSNPNNNKPKENLTRAQKISKLQRNRDNFRTKSTRNSNRNIRKIEKSTVNNFSKMINRVKNNANDFVTRESDSLFIRITKAYQREGLKRLNSTNINLNNLPSTQKRNNEKKSDLFEGIE